MLRRGLLTSVAIAMTVVTSVSAEGPELVDRIVAVVDEDPILASDLDRVIGLGLVEPRADETEKSFRRRVLDQLIEERLRFHEIDRFGFTEVSLSDVEVGLQAIRDRFRDEKVFGQTLEEVGMDEEGLKQLVARQLMVMTYVDERLGPRVFVSGDEIRSYYETTLVPELRQRGESVADLAAVREEIREVLKEQRLNEEIERWTADLRAEADIEDYFESEHSAPPSLPVVGDSGVY